MINKILKSIVYQNKYSRYKYLFSICLDDLINFGGPKFIKLLKELTLNEEYGTIKYFRLDSIYGSDYFSQEKGFILISINNLIDIENKIELLKTFDKYKIKYKLIYKIKLESLYFENKIYDYIKNKNIIFYIKSLYEKVDVDFVQNKSSFFYDKEVFLGLDYLNRQEEVEHENIFEIIDLIKKSNGIVNNDFIRLESSHKSIYILGPKELHFDLYEYCNASCNFCYTNGPGFLDKRDDKENNFKIHIKGEHYIKLFKNIIKSHTECLAIGITGEPLIHPEIKYILEELSKIDIKVGFLTNGYKLLENIDLLIKNKNLIHLYINISSGDYNSFKATRPNDSFQDFINTWTAIKLFRQKRPDIVVRGLYVITPQNIKGISNFIELSIKNNLSEIELKRVVPYGFSKDEFFFNENDIKTIIQIVNKFKEKDIKINHNFDYIINEFNEVKKGIVFQYPEDENIDKSKLVGRTTNCYNPYFYISIFRNSSFTCGKFEAKIGDMENIDLYNLLFEKKELNNILKSADNIKEYLGENKWKEKCSRCHHMDVNNMVSDYIRIKNISLKL